MSKYGVQTYGDVCAWYQVCFFGSIVACDYHTVGPRNISSMSKVKKRLRRAQTTHRPRDVTPCGSGMSLDRGWTP